MKLVKAYNSVSLVLRIVIGMVIGAALALLIPNAAVTAPGIGILGTLFVGALKAIAPLLESNLKKAFISIVVWMPYLLLSERVNVTYRWRQPA